MEMGRLKGYSKYLGIFFDIKVYNCLVYSYLLFDFSSKPSKNDPFNKRVCIDNRLEW